PRRRSDRERARRVEPRRDGQLQGSALRRARRRVAAERDGQGPQVRAARPRHQARHSLNLTGGHLHRDQMVAILMLPLVSLTSTCTVSVVPWESVTVHGIVVCGFATRTVLPGAHDAVT